MWRDRKALVTPTTDGGARRYDHLPAESAALMAWTTPGPNPRWHAATVRQVRDAMPVLARALDRAAAERGLPRP